MFKRFITWFLGHVRPVPPLRDRPVSAPHQSAALKLAHVDADEKGSLSLRKKASGISANTGSTETDQADRSPSFDWSAIPINGRLLYSIWPRSDDREDTDVIYGKLEHIFGADRIDQAGGRGDTQVAFWEVWATEDEITRVRELELSDAQSINVYRCRPCRRDPTC